MKITTYQCDACGERWEATDKGGHPPPVRIGDTDYGHVCERCVRICKELLSGQADHAFVPKSDPMTRASVRESK